MRVLSVDPGRKNLGLCVLAADLADPTGAHDLIEYWTVREAPADAHGLKRALTDMLDGVAYDEVVIERQPPRNPSMKRLEHLFEMYFAMLNKPVRVFDARNKLAFAMRTPHWATAGRGVVWSNYGHRKKLAVTIVAAFLEASGAHNTAFQSMFKTAKKKDDFSDALLQAQAYAHNVQ